MITSPGWSRLNAVLKSNQIPKRCLILNQCKPVIKQPMFTRCCKICKTAVNYLQTYKTSMDFRVMALHIKPLLHSPQNSQSAGFHLSH